MIYLLLAIIALFTTGLLFAPLAKQSRQQAITLAALMCMAVLGLWVVMGGAAGIGLNPMASSGQKAEQSGALNSESSSEALDAQRSRDLVKELRKTLVDTKSEDTQGWYLLARSEMRIGDYDQALQAYSNAASYADPATAEAILVERQAAQDYIAQNTSASSNAMAPTTSGQMQNGPNQADIEAAAQMSDEERQTMILGMVNGLSQKLMDSPNDPAGWVRLLRARQVLGDNEALQADIERMKSAFASEPDKIAQILNQSGLN